MNIFVGNLSFDTTEADLKQLFETIGEVSSVVIVMEKEKKAPKSRGFGFVEMPAEAQALSAISALNGRDFMGRLLNVNLTRPKTEAQRQSEIEKRTFLKAKAKMKVKDNLYQNESSVGKEASARPFIPKPGAYKGGRRTRSYAIRTGAPVDMRKGTKPWLKSLENPMRWRKPGQVRPWEKTEGASQAVKPWQKSAGGAKPWQRSSRGRKPWEKTEGASQEVKPWKRPAGIGVKPWQRPETASVEAKPWKKTSVEAKPWKKPVGSSKPWIKKSERPQGSRFKARVPRAASAHT
ncbi:MAG: RNA-binding protein [Candidatus Omnitrophota bacterium]|jgi:hypothetical protein